MNTRIRKLPWIMSTDMTIIFITNQTKYMYLVQKLNIELKKLSALFYSLKKSLLRSQRNNMTSMEQGA